MSDRPSLALLGPQTLLLDADDTLWENGVLFERAIASFITLLDHAVHSPAEVREHLDRIERATIAERGYGSRSFQHSLLRCFAELAKVELTADQHLRIGHLVDDILGAPVMLLPGVPEALHKLSARHRLLLVTKGDDLEQREKLVRSGLAQLFSGVEVLAEKSAPAYSAILQRYRLDPTSTWMIGNSPRSDINAALRAGLHAVFIPHAETWVLEHEGLLTPATGQHLLKVASLLELTFQL